MANRAAAARGTLSGCGTKLRPRVRFQQSGFIQPNTVTCMEKPRGPAAASALFPWRMPGHGRPRYWKSKAESPVAISSSPSGRVTGGSMRERQPTRSHRRQAGPTGVTLPSAGSAAA